MSMYRKKPVVIEARQLADRNVIELFRWCGASEWDEDPIKLYIRTLEGTMRAEEGDFIIKGVNGEFYPCKPDIFEKTYELVEE